MAIRMDRYHRIRFCVYQSVYKEGEFVLYFYSLLLFLPFFSFFFRIFHFPKISHLFVGDIYDGGTSIVEGYLRSSEIDGVIGNLFVFSAKKVFEKSSSKVYSKKGVGTAVANLNGLLYFEI